MATPYRILFVCTGNICRSPVAEAVARHVFTQAGLADHVTVSSAGIQDYHTGQAPDPRSIASAAAKGVSMDGIIAKKVKKTDFEAFDMVLAMDGTHFKALKALAGPVHRPKVHYFMRFAHETTLNPDVPDPYYGSTKDFERVIDMIEQGVDGLLNHLRQNGHISLG